MMMHELEFYRALYEALLIDGRIVAIAIGPL